MDIILFRHGPAEPRGAERWPEDSLRPLTSRGRSRTQRAAAGLARIAPNIGRVLTSPHVRAAQSAQALKDALPDAAVGILGALRPGGRPQEILDALGEMRGVEAVALVGHEPDLGRLAGVLAFGGEAPLPLKKAGACAIRFENEVRPGPGRLIWLLPPRMLRRLAGRKERV